MFIGACMRTGTTLLQSILCGDSATNPPIPEAALMAKKEAEFFKRFFGGGSIVIAQFLQQVAGQADPKGGVIRPGGGDSKVVFIIVKPHVDLSRDSP